LQLTKNIFINYGIKSLRTHQWRALNWLLVITIVATPRKYWYVTDLILCYQQN
jgi:hypothetical protein